MIFVGIFDGIYGTLWNQPVIMDVQKLCWLIYVGGFCKSIEVDSWQ